MLRLFTLLFLISLPSLLFSQSLTDSLLLYYPFDGNAKDCSGNGYDGTAVGVQDTSDRFGNTNSAYYFNNLNTYVDLPSISDLKPTDFPVTFSFWVKMEQVGIYQNSFFSTDFQQNNYHGYWMRVNDSNQLIVGFGSGYGNTGSQNRRNIKTDEDIFDTDWKHFIGVVRGPTDMDLYINCHLMSSTLSGSGGNNVAYSNIPGRIGAQDCNTSAPPGYLIGFLDEFAFWDRELTSTEISSLCEISNINTCITTNIEKEKYAAEITDGNIEILISAKEDGNIEVSNLNGQVIHKENLEKNKALRILKNRFKNGIYLVTVQNKYGDFITRKIVVMH